MKRIGLMVIVLGWVAGLAAASVRGNDLSRDEEVVFFPTAAAYDPQSAETTLFIHGWIYELELSSLTRQAALSSIARLCEFDDDEQASTLFRERAARFLVDNERNQELVIRLGSRAVTLSSSQENGHIRSLVKLPTAELQKILHRRGEAPATVEFATVAPRGDTRTFRGRVHLIEADGWSIVSDVDDTIKDSNVLDKPELLRNTFVRKFEAVPGMAEAYTKWSRAGAAVHYVTGSPWQLYPALESFAAAEGFPAGAWQLRYARLQDGTAWQMLQTPEKYKQSTIEDLLRQFPRRKFVFVGDTGERDPEVYGDLARRFPERVRLVALRNITNETLDNARMKVALGGVPPQQTLLFRLPTELPALDVIK